MKRLLRERSREFGGVCGAGVGDLALLETFRAGLGRDLLDGLSLYAGEFL
jgi:hypothetical protein